MFKNEKGLVNKKSTAKKQKKIEELKKEVKNE